MRAPHLAHAAAAQQLDKAITPERRALHRLTIRSQTLHRQAFETPAGAMWSRPCSIGEVPRRLYGPNLRACATSTPSTPSCGCWPLCAVRSASMVASRRVVRSTRCWTNATSQPEADRATRFCRPPWRGRVCLDRLPAPQFAPQTQTPEPASGASGDPAAILAAIESLAGLHQRGILSDEEFAAKKAELLGRL